jgi:hypothetical protein
MYGFHKGDYIDIEEYSPMDNLYKVTNNSGYDYRWLTEYDISKHFMFSNPSLDDMVGFGLTTKCECGSHKTYGTKIEGWQHSSWCPIYSKR